MTLRSAFLEFDDALASHAVPPLTTWWRDGIGEWLDAYENGHVLELYACVGRGAAKSTALYKLATFFSLFGEFAIPPGERHYAIVLSRLKSEAEKALGIIDSWLTALAVPHHVTGDVVELDNGDRRGIRVVAASVAASSGWRAFFVAKDERSKWPSGGVEDLDSEEIDTSAAAMTITHPLAPILSFGSAWGAAGPFHHSITTPDASRIVLGPTPTWIAAPHISEESTRRRESDQRRWLREYACNFQAGALGAFDADDVHAMVRFIHRDSQDMGSGAMFIDSSSGRHDGWSYCIVAYTLEPSGESPCLMETLDKHDQDGRPAPMIVPRCDAAGIPIRNPAYHDPRHILVVGELGAFEGAFGSEIPFDQVVYHCASLARRAGVSNVYGDQHLAFALTSEFRKHQINYTNLDWSAPTKVEAAATLRRLFRERSLVTPPGHEAEKLTRELMTMEERILPSGGLTVTARRGGSGHADRASLLLLIARAESEGLIAGSPIARPRGAPVREYDPYSGESRRIDHNEHGYQWRSQ